MSTATIVWLSIGIGALLLYSALSLLPNRHNNLRAEVDALKASMVTQRDLAESFAVLRCELLHVLTQRGG